MIESLRSLEEKLNNIIDAEFEKETIDCALISAAVDGLLRMENYEKYVITVSERDKRIEAIINGNKTKSRIMSFSRTARIILVAALIAVILAVAVFAYTGIRYQITNHKEYSYIWNYILPDRTVEDFTVDYMPEGYILREEYKIKYAIGKQFFDESDNLIAIIRSSYLNADYNTEFKVEKAIVIDNIEYIVFGESIYGRGVLFYHKGYCYIVASDISEDELLKVAQAIHEK